MNYDELLVELFKAYYDCRKNKRKTINQLQFELDYEINLISLADEISTGNYKIGKSIAFIVDKPVKREIFAGDFRDRIVHHYLINKLNYIFEKDFIYDSYSCRVGKGTLFGTKRLEKTIRSCSNNYQVDCYVLKLDVQGFFMSINKDILFKKIKKILEKRINNLDFDFIINLIEKIIYNNPTKNCIIKGNRLNWEGLPKNKSLFFAKENTGLPIGNLTSQVFANIYLSDFDKFVKYNLNPDFGNFGLYYGRYVDDFFIVHKDKEFLQSIIPKIKDYLNDNLLLDLHPKKIYLQHYSKGVLFLGTFIKPYRTYPGKRLKSNFYQKIIILNNQIIENNGKTNSEMIVKFRSIINSYLGFLKHNNSYNLKKKYLFELISPYYWNYFYISGGYSKVKIKTKMIR